MSGRIPEQIIQQIKDRVSIREVVSQYVTLKRTGASYKGLCPFHHEKTPSFNVHEGMQIYRCFGCGESGNVFGFVMKMEGLSFPEAVRKLAASAGVTIPEIEPSPEEVRAQELRGRLFRVNELAEKFFRRQMETTPAGRAGREYLLRRGLTLEVIERFQLGYAPDSWDSLLNHLKGQGVPEALAQEAGLIIAREGGGYYDRFRHRVMFPIRDISGRVAGFGGRVLGEGEPKYLNSPETAVFKKGKGFYGLDLAKEAIRREDRVVVVEGYLDLIALVQHGVSYTVATLGTALTADHAGILRRYTHNVFLVFDADEAGIKASLRSLEVFLDEGLSPRIALMPEGQDPDDFVRTAGRESFLGRLEAAPLLVDFFMERELQAAGSAPGRIAQAVKKLGPVLARIRDPIERGLYARRLAEAAGVPEVEVRRRMLMPSAGPAVSAGAEETAAFPPLEQNLLYLLLRHPRTAPRVKEAGVLAEISSAELREFCRVMLEQIELRGQADPAAVLHRFSGGPVADLVSRLVLEDRGESAEQVERLTRDTIQGLRLQRLRSEKRELNQAIQAADRARDLARFRELQMKKHELERQEREMAGGVKAE